MFGILRLLLAALVVYQHAWGHHPWSGQFAVLAFFTLSGYLMTLIVHEKYGLDGQGLLRFAINRGLRIFPAYWFVLTCTLLVMWLFTGTDFFSRNVYDRLVIPNSLGEWLPTIFIFGQWTWLQSQLIPQAWALNFELIYYLAIPIFIGKRREYALACLVTSLAYTIWVCHLHLPIGDRYYLPIAGMLPFSLGAVIYHYRDVFKPSPSLACLLTLLAFAHLFVYSGMDKDYVLNVPLYLNVFLFGSAVWALAKLEPPTLLARFDEYCGRLSYPIYLNHFLVLGLVLWFAPELPRTGAQTFLYVLTVSVVWSAFSWWLVERPIEKLRFRVAQQHAKMPTLAPNLRQSIGSN